MNTPRPIAVEAEHRFIDAQVAAELAYKDETRWTRMSILNTACSGRFSTDRTMRDYNDDIWHLDPIELE